MGRENRLTLLSWEWGKEKKGRNEVYMGNQRYFLHVANPGQ
jgi:hypothetical protein